MKLALYTALSCIVLLLCLFFFIEGYTIFNIDIRIVFVLLFTVLAALLAALLAAEYYRYNTAKLIMDNKIIYIQVTKIEENCEKKIYNTLSTIVIEYIISCFGVLLGSKVIKFNVDGIKLIEVKIDHDFIFIVYGKDNWNKTIRLLHGSLSTQELRDFVERFRYETGITPNVID